MEIPKPGEKAEVALSITSADFAKLVDAVNRIDYFTQDGTDNIAGVMQRINSTTRTRTAAVSTMVFLANFVREIVGPRVDFLRSVERELEREEP